MTEIGWEYKWVNIDYLEELQLYGDGGWELCAMFEKRKDEFITISNTPYQEAVTVKEYYQCIFKRNKNE